MTWTASTPTVTNVLAYHLDDEKVRVQVGFQSADLGPEQRRGLAEYLVKDLPE